MELSETSLGKHESDWVAHRCLKQEEHEHVSSHPSEGLRSDRMFLPFYLLNNFDQYMISIK